jgi:hypothetical protein
MEAGMEVSLKRRRTARSIPLSRSFNFDDTEESVSKDARERLERAEEDLVYYKRAVAILLAAVKLIANELEGEGENLVESIGNLAERLSGLAEE